MGSFIGHVIPGSFFVIFALWWLTDTLNCYFKKEGRFKSRIVQYVTVCQGRRQVAVMAWVVLVTTTIGIIVELIIAPARNHAHPGGANIQHGTMYFFFALVGIQALILDRCAPNLLRRQTEYASITLAFIVEAILFNFHLQGRKNIDVTMHTLLVYTIFTTVIVLLFEVRYEHSLALAITRSYFTMLQGTWFFQLAVTLYNPVRDPWGHHIEDIDKEHPHMNMLAASMFSWHMGVIFILYAVVVLVWSKRHGSGRSYDEEELLGNPEGTHSLLPQEDPEPMDSV